MKRSSFQVSQSSLPAPASSSVAAVIKRYRWVVIWCCFHLCALLLSYKEVAFFNNTGEPKTDKFWPFVKFTYPYFLPHDNTTYNEFNGIFTQYDWTEYSFYTGIVLVGILLVYVNKKSK